MLFCINFEVLVYSECFWTNKAMSTTFSIWKLFYTKSYDSKQQNIEIGSFEIVWIEIENLKIKNKIKK